MKPRILVVQPLMEEGLELLREVGDVEVFESDRMITREELVARTAMGARRIHVLCVEPLAPAVSPRALLQQWHLRHGGG